MLGEQLHLPGMEPKSCPPMITPGGHEWVCLNGDSCNGRLHYYVPVEQVAS